MNSVKATWTDGRIVLDDRVDWPEGRRLVIQEEPIAEIEFMTEDEQGDDPVSIQRWIDEVRAIPALPCDPVREAEHTAWREKMKAFNIEAVRRQMKEGIE